MQQLQTYLKQPVVTPAQRDGSCSRLHEMVGSHYQPHQASSHPIGRMRAKVRAAEQAKIVPLCRHACSALRRKMMGSDLALALTSNRTKVLTSCYHRPDETGSGVVTHKLGVCEDLIDNTLTHVCYNGVHAHTFLCDLEPNKSTRQVSETTHKLRTREDEDN